MRDDDEQFRVLDVRHPFRLLLIGLVCGLCAPACGSGQPSPGASTLGIDNDPASPDSVSDDDSDDDDSDGWELDYDPKSLVRFELIAPAAEFATGTQQTFGAIFHIAEGWHIYWINPGDSGLPTKIEFADVAGATVGAPAFPGPVRFESDGDITNYGYNGTLAVPVTITPTQDPPDPRATIQISARATWLACRDDACVPGDGRATLAWAPGSPAATAGDPEAERALIAAGLARLPRPVSELATRADIDFEVGGPGDGSSRGQTRAPGVQVHVRGSGDVAFDIFPVRDQAISAVERGTPGDRRSLRFALHPEGDPRQLAVLAVRRTGETRFYALTGQLLKARSSR